MSSAFAQNFSTSDLIAAVNNLRVNYGLQPYEVDGGLMAMANEHSAYQASIGSATHTHSDGNRPSSFGVTENIASGTTEFMTIDFVINQVWSDSLHMNTMIGYESGYVGAGIATGGGNMYVTLEVRPGKSAATLSPGGSNQAAGPNPIPGTQIALVPLEKSTPDANGAIVHQVGYGQSLWSIAIAYEVKIDEIRTLNGLAFDSTDIYAGQKLVIRPAGSAQQPVGPESETPAAAQTEAASSIESVVASSTMPASTLSATVSPSVSEAIETTLPTASKVENEPSFKNGSLPAGRRLLAIGLILVGMAGVVWVIRSGFLTSKAQ